MTKFEMVNCTFKPAINDKPAKRQEPAFSALYKKGVEKETSRKSAKKQSVKETFIFTPKINK